MAEEYELRLVQHRSKRLKKQNPSFMAEVKDDLLTEILLRLPHRRSAIQTSLVCKQWGSIINSDHFVKRFSQPHHPRRYIDPSYALPFTLLFKFERKINDIVFSSHELSSGNIPQGIHHYPLGTKYLDFLPETWGDWIIRTSSEDLLLLFDFVRRYYCVCNPLTRQWNIFPMIWSANIYYSSCGLWRDHSAAGKALGEYKVVFLHRAVYDAGGDLSLGTEIFCPSEGGRWSHVDFTAPKDSFPWGELSCFGQAVTSNGVFFFPLRIRAMELGGFLALEPAEERCHVIKVPAGFGSGWRARRSRVCVGVVRGELRISQLLKDGVNGDISLGVWELFYDGGGYLWKLVHDARLRKHNRDMVFVVAFHPNNADVLFVTINNRIYKYDVVRDLYHKIGEIPNVKRNTREKGRLTDGFLYVVPFVHTFLPRRILV